LSDLQHTAKEKLKAFFASERVECINSTVSIFLF